MSRSICAMIDGMIQHYIDILSMQFQIPREQLEICWNHLDDSGKEVYATEVVYQDKKIRHMEDDMLPRTIEDLQKLKIMELKKLCKQHALKPQGNKNDLIQLLANYYETQVSQDDRHTIVPPPTPSLVLSCPSKLKCFHQEDEEEEDYDFGNYGGSDEEEEERDEDGNVVVDSDREDEEETFA